MTRIQQTMASSSYFTGKSSSQGRSWAASSHQEVEEVLTCFDMFRHVSTSCSLHCLTLLAFNTTHSPVLYLCQSLSAPSGQNRWVRSIRNVESVVLRRWWMKGRLVMKKIALHVSDHSRRNCLAHRPGWELVGLLRLLKDYIVTLRIWLAQGLVG